MVNKFGPRRVSASERMPRWLCENVFLNASVRARVTSCLQDDITQIMEEGNLQCKLEELDRLEEESKDSAEPAW